MFIQLFPPYIRYSVLQFKDKGDETLMGYCYNNNVGGTSYRKHCHNTGDVHRESFKVPVYAYIDSRDFCSAVDRCLAPEKENYHHHHHCRFNRF